MKYNKKYGAVNSGNKLASGGGMIARLAAVVARVGMFFMVILAVGSAAAEWEVETLKANPLDEGGVDTFVVSGDFIAPVSGYSPGYPYEGLRAKLRYNCAVSLGSDKHWRVVQLFFNKKPNLQKTFDATYGAGLADFRVKGDGGKTRSVIMGSSHLKGVTFAAIRSWSLLLGADLFGFDEILSHNSVIVGVPWHDKTEVLFEFQITPEMRAGVEELKNVCGGDNNEDETRDDEIKEKAPPSHRK